MKKNLMFKLGLFCAALVLVATCLVTGTWAKYTSTKALTSDTATVAKWDIKVEGSSMVTGTPTINFNLFTTIVDTKDGNADEDVETKKIAPGTKGSFELDVKNDSEVNATFEIAFTATNDSGVPLQFSTDGENWENNISDINVEATTVNMGDTGTITVYWQWVFTTDASGDTSDTTLGTMATAPTVQVTATITAKQVD